VTQFYTGRVEGNRAGLLDDLLDLAGGDEQEFSVIVNEAGNEPGTGNAVHMNVRAGDPKHVLFSFSPL
jgi:hypothetical protein